MVETSANSVNPMVNGGGDPGVKKLKRVGCHGKSVDLRGRGWEVLDGKPKPGNAHSVKGVGGPGG